MAAEPDPEAQTEAFLVETRRRAGRINRYVDLIPARFYLSSEALQAHKPRSGLDPAQYKPTSQLLAEVVAAAAPATCAGSSSNAGSRKKKAKKQSAAAVASTESPASRADLRQLLERRIAELKEERRRKQSAADREKTVVSGKSSAAKEKRPREEEASSSVPKRQRPEGMPSSSINEDVEAGRLSFEPRTSELPFEAGVNRRGNKVRQLRANLRREESKIRKLGEAEVNGDRDALRNEYALDTALRRAKGEKVHDDVSRLRKAQKQLEVRKSKGKDKWDSRIEANAKAAEDKQQKRKENLQNRKSSKKKGGKGRDGFEGRKASYLNSEP